MRSTGAIGRLGVVRKNGLGYMGRANLGAGIKRQARTGAILAVAQGGPGGGVMDKPDTKKTPGKARQSKQPPMYNVMLHNDNVNRKEYVVRVLLKVVEIITAADAAAIMEEAHVTGVALVCRVSQEMAEQYCERLRNNGLTSTIEPG